MDEMILSRLDHRLGTARARSRLKFEAEHQAQVFGQGLTLFHLENWFSAPTIIRTALRVFGLYQRAQRNAGNIVVSRTELALAGLPISFDGFTILHVSDLHADISERAMENLIKVIGRLPCDICVLTGDYRGKTYGPYEAAMAWVAELRALIASPVYAVLGNHDTIEMVPLLEEMGIRVLLNEHETVIRGTDRIYLAGIDDAHFYRADDIGAAASGISVACGLDR